MCNNQLKPVKKYSVNMKISETNMKMSQNKNKMISCKNQLKNQVINWMKN